MSWLTLDGMLARDLCRAYGLPHEVISLDQEFRSKLPTYATRASLLSGGVLSIEEAHEVFYHEKVSQRFTSRLSGNFGNQIGREGVERVSARRANLSILHPELPHLPSSILDVPGLANRWRGKPKG
ncbi:MAG: hypothetical protein HY348_06505 [Nitrospira defluvii]|nr:hypothetical protein [Nitrospira defluvii]